MFAEELIRAADEYGINLSEKQVDLFNKYYEILIEWNEKINLTAIIDPRSVAVKHMIDSLSCYDESCFPQGCRVIDVGTGAGFPGLPLKIIRPDIQLVLLDSLNKRLNFLQRVVDELDLPDVQTVHARAEEGGRKKELRETFDVALSRAVARLHVLSELCLPYVKVGGWFIALKGAKYEEEVEEARRAVALLGAKSIKTVRVELPGLDDKRAILYIQKLKNTPLAYPRNAGQMAKKPLAGK